MLCDDLVSICLDHYIDRVVDVYLDIRIDDIGTEVGSSSVRLETNEGANIDENDTNETDSECEDFSDSEYEMGEAEEENDDELFNENTNMDAEWTGNNDREGGEPDGGADSDGGIEGTKGSSDENFDSGEGSDAEQGSKFPIFNNVDTYDPKFELGMIFSNKTEFRLVVHSHAIKTKRTLKITKNDGRRIYAKCGVEGCDWRIHALKLAKEHTFQIREYYPKHKCGVTYNVKNVKSTWLSGKYESSFRSDPKRNVKGFRNDVIRDIRVGVSKSQAYRAKHKAIEKIEGKAEEQYGMLWDYADELRRSNPRSTVILKVSNNMDAVGAKAFQKFYVCFEGLKQGFKSGCRPFIGVDGCHLKGPFGGVLLTAVGIDPNNNSFPIAYAVVNKENKDNWEWFLLLLKVDLNITREYEYTFISDKQKGLLQAFDSVFPACENRFCVRHLHGNMKRAGFKRLAYKKALWKCALASTVPDFEKRMKEMEKIDKHVIEWFSDKHPSQWSRSYFSTVSKCDILLNNLCESFNATNECKGKTYLDNARRNKGDVDD
ncbi:UNVERIFIED_CONTAM: hypothetical protein Sindi_2867900 [Sesamum indicum]